MSRIGRAPVELPSSVSVDISGANMKITGPQGELHVPIGEGVTVSEEEGALVCERASEEPKHRAMHGLTRSLLQNAVTGVTEGFTKTLNIQGVGYRAQLQGQNLNLQVGYSHPVTVEPRGGVSFETPTTTTIIIRGIDKQSVGQLAAEIRSIRPPEPYKGKGIRYSDEQVRRKVGKAG